jgi:hypothetical protein
MKNYLTGLLLVLLAGPQAVAAEPLSPYVSGDGAIAMPPNFRTTMTHLGSWFVPGGDASGFHDVYAEEWAVRAYQQTGKFPDGAVLVKELRAHSSGTYTTGENVSYANDGLKQWFVMVKDASNRFPKNKSWGDGWGWALFQPGKSGNVSKDYKADCLGCHVPARENDWLYTEAYPTLKAQ